MINYLSYENIKTYARKDSKIRWRGKPPCRNVLVDGHSLFLPKSFAYNFTIEQADASTAGRGKTYLYSNGMVGKAKGEGQRKLFVTSQKLFARRQVLFAKK